MIMKSQRKITLVNSCNAVFNEEELISAMLWYTDRPIVSRKTVSMYGKYPGVSIYKEKIHIHRLLVKYWSKTNLSRLQHIHHLDGNKLNAQRYNLKLLSASEHSSLENTGKKLKPDQVAKIIERNRRSKGVKKLRRYSFKHHDLSDVARKQRSINSVAKSYGCDWSTVKMHLDEFLQGNPELMGAA